MAEVLSKMYYLKRNSFSVMFVTIALLFVVPPVFSQENQALSPAAPTNALPVPFMDLFTAPSNYYPEQIRKTYPDPGYYHVSCPKSDSLSSFASVLGSAAKIMMSAAVIVFLKVAAGKLLLLPLTVMLIAKAGLKAVLLWPMLSKMIKYFKKKKKKGHKSSRMITDCTERITCVMQRSSQEGWASHLGAAATFSLINDVDKDAPFAKVLLSVLAGENIAQCMSLDCGSGINVS